MTEARDLHTQNVNIRDAELRLTALDVSNQLPRQVTHSVFKTKNLAKWHVQKLTHRTTQIHIDATDILRQNMCFLFYALKMQSKRFYYQLVHLYSLKDIALYLSISHSRSKLNNIHVQSMLPEDQKNITTQ